jgi:putative ABC transport system ATP-binding protein
MNTPASDVNAILDVRNITKSYSKETKILKGVSLQCQEGTFTAIMGPSGSGKSTFLNCIAALDSADGGEIWLAGKNVSDTKEPALTKLRRQQIGFVFQSYNLVDALSVMDNVLLPQQLAGVKSDTQWIELLFERVGLQGKEKLYPAQLSGGQQQRVALVRALAGRPAIIFADEPTGALDIATGHEILALLRQAVDEFGATLVMVTHDPNAAAQADRVVFMADGSITDTLLAPTARQVAAHMTELDER